MTTDTEAARFFRRYPRLRETSMTGVRGERLEYRYRALIERNVDVIRDCRVLDLASHDGRWTLAALDAGAFHVTGIEGRESLVARAAATLEAYGFAPHQHHLLHGDCLAQLARLDVGSFDTVFCFGFLYHTLRQFDLLRAITELQPHTLLIDSRVVPRGEPAIVLAYDDSSLEGAAIRSGDAPHPVLVGIPTPAAILQMLDHLGWRVTVQEPLSSNTPDWDGIRDYRCGRRLSLRATRV